MDMPDDIKESAPEGVPERPPPQECDADGCETVVEPVQTFRGGWMPPTDYCSDCDARKRRRQRELKKLREGFRNAWKAAGVPPKPADDAQKELGYAREAKKAARLILDTPPSGGEFPCAIYLHGPVGSGKSTLGATILRSYLKRWRLKKHDRIDEYGPDYRGEWERCHARFCSVPKMFHDKKESFDSQEHVDLTQYHDVDLLVLDDLGREQAGSSGWRPEQIYLLVDERYQHRRPTVFTSNFALQNLPEANRENSRGKNTNYDDRITSRIAEMCGSRHGQLWQVRLSDNHRNYQG